MAPSRRAPLLALALLAAALPGCMKPWSPPTVPHATADAHQGCLDLRATLAKDRGVPATSALVAFAFQNHCEVAVELDWRAVVVTGYETADGEPVRLLPFDPGHRVDAGRLDAMSEGNEALRFDAPGDDDADEACDDDDDPRPRRRRKPRFVRVCVDYAAVAKDAPGPPPAPVCLAAPGDPSVVDLNRSGFRPALGATPYGWTGPEFGLWDTSGWPRISEEVGLSFQSWHLDGRSLRDAGEHPVRVLGFGSGDAARGATFDLRFRSYVVGPLYLGLDASVGGGLAPGDMRYAAQDGARVRRTDAGATLIALGGHVGGAVRIGRLQPFAEVGVGVSGVVVSGDDPDGNLRALWASVTPRAGALWWIDPHVTVGAYAGVDVTDPRNQTLGLSVAVHLRSFDGNR